MSTAQASTGHPFVAGGGRRVDFPAPARLIAVPAAGRSDVDQHLAMVDALLTEVISELAEIWATLPDDDHGRLEILGDVDIPNFISAMIGGGGKRLRPIMVYLGWLSCGGRSRDIGRQEIVRVSAALELLHLFALVHDDVMDESASRRGLPTVHVKAQQLHLANAAVGSGQRFGESIAILVGDLAQAEAGHLVAGLPAPMRSIWRVLVAELVAGQRRDLIGSAVGPQRRRLRPHGRQDEVGSLHRWSATRTGRGRCGRVHRFGRPARRIRPGRWRGVRPPRRPPGHLGRPGTDRQACRGRSDLGQAHGHPGARPDQAAHGGWAPGFVVGRNGRFLGPRT